MVRKLSLDWIDDMTEKEQDQFMKVFDAQLAFDDGAAAAEHWAAGHPVVYARHDTPPGCVLEEYPDGRIDVVDYTGEVPVVVRTTLAVIRSRAVIYSGGSDEA